MPVESAAAVFEALAAHAREPMLVDAAGSWEFDIEGVGTWTVAVDHGALSVTEDAPPPGAQVSEARVRLRMREDELVRLAHGDAHENLFTGVIRGAIVIEGALAFAQRLQAILPLHRERSAQT
jgi:hypothetical protein